MSSLFNGSMGQSGVDTGDIPASLRFRAAASAYLNDTSITPTASNVWTLSVWVKRGLLGSPQYIFSSDPGANDASLIQFTTADELEIANIIGGGYATRKITNAKFRDVTSWLHIVVSCNSSSSFSLHVNGVAQTFSTSVGPNTSGWYFNTNAYVRNIGRNAFSNVAYLDGYMSRVCFVDGTALAPSSFGYLNTEINEWVSKSQSAVKAVVDAGGANSFMLDFDNATSLTTLGYDKSSKGNNWTLNNFSLTAGATYDWMLDVPGNSFATLNPIDRLGATSNFDVISYGNLKVATNSAATLGSVGSMYMPSGSWYWETTPNTWTSSLVRVGVATPAAAQYCAYYSRTGEKNINGSLTAYGATYTLGDVIGVGYDATAGTVTFYKNGVSQGTLSGIPSGAAPWVSDESGGGSVTLDLNFGQAPLHASATYHSAAGGYFRYAPPAGYKALCQRNLPDPAILNPEKHMDVVTRTGTAATYSVAGLGFQPDLVWVKSRGRAVDHALYDSVRGGQKQLESNQTGVETTESTGLTAFNSGGYTGGALDQINGTTATNSFVDWLWKAGGAAVTNNAGSISSQVSANVTAGFSIVTYTGNLSSAGTATVGHGLGKAPSLIISKSRNNAGGDSGQWVARHKYLASANHYLRLNTTDTPVDSSANGSMSASTSTVFSTNWTSGMNVNGGNFVAYCFAEIPGFSKIFSYTGNGSADGPFVHCGFKPKFILVKRTDSSTYGNWEIIDTVRDTYNQSFNDLIANLSNAENVDGATWDILSNGFKCRDGSSTGNKNVNGGTYIGIAFADVPANYSLAR